jgi:hypothetical protein
MMVGVAYRSPVAALLLACAAAAQNAPPGPLSLMQIKSRMLDELSRLPDYTCLETINRFDNYPSEQARSRRLEQVDTVRLEVAYSNHREWYGSPGDKTFSTDDPRGFVGSGLIGTGAFAMILHNVFVVKDARIAYGGKADLEGRTVARYDFRLRRPALEVSLAGGFGTVGQEGSFWVDPQTLDVIRLEAHAIEIPPYVPLVDDVTLVNYARTRLGDYSALLPQQAALQMLETAGQDSYNWIEFTHCRNFSAQSVIRFDSKPGDQTEPPPGSSKTLSAQDAVLEPVAPSLPVTLELTTSITDKDAVGTLIGAKVAGDVVRNRKVIVPNGALARGRIRRLERYYGARGKEFIVGLEFTEVEANGRPLRFYAELVQLEKRAGIRPSFSERVLVTTRTGVATRTQTVRLRELPGVASFFVDGATFTIPSGFRMVWRTRGLIHGE